MWAPKQIILDLDATDDRCTASRRGDFSTATTIATAICPSTCSAGADPLLAQLRRSALDAADGAVEEMAVIVAQIGVGGLGCASCCAPNSRLRAGRSDGLVRGQWGRLPVRVGANAGLSPRSRPSLILPPPELDDTGRPERRFKSFMWMTRRSWSRRRRVVAKAEVDARGSQSPLCGHLAAARRSARPSISTRRSTARGEQRRTGSRNASSTSMRIAPRRPPCGPTSCACGSTLWLMSCSAPALSGSTIPTSPRPPAAPSGSSCSRSARSCASASAASSSPWRPLVPAARDWGRAGSRLHRRLGPRLAGMIRPAAV